MEAFKQVLLCHFQLVHHVYRRFLGLGPLLVVHHMGMDLDLPQMLLESGNLWA